MKAGVARQLAPAATALALFAFFAALYVSGQRETYSGLLKAWGMRPYPWPFLDTDTVLSAVRCLNAGIDAYAANPCDPELRAYDYSPLWMGLTAFPVTTAWIPWVGCAFFACFVAGLAMLPAGRTREATILVLLGLVSTPVMLGVERGNNDLVVFLVVAGMASLLASAHPARRWAGYALGVLAGLLKYYPLLTMAAALRERPGRFFAIAAAAIVVTGLFIALTWANLSRALAIIPTGSPYYYMFGAKNLAFGIQLLFKLPDWFTPLVRAALTVGALALGLRLGLRASTADAIGRLTPREASFLMVGALMALGCFLSAQNIIYRTLDLLLVLPSFTALRILGGPRRLTTGVWVVLGLLWHEWYSRAVLVFTPKVAGKLGMWLEVTIGWLPRELAWWWLVVVLTSCVAALLRDGPLPAMLLSKRAT